jgi:predicted negative regulator of RcsB-dependent stress response
MLQKVTLGLLLTAVLALTGTFGVRYFQEHYILLNEQDVEQLDKTVQMLQYRAYQAGTQACNKST